MTFDASTHKNILVRILKDIFSNSVIGPYLGFKGGTAALLFYHLSRFSVDLDFDLLDESKEEIVFNELQKTLSNYGKIKQAQKKRYSLFFLLSYENKKEGAFNIKIEVNKRYFGSKYELKEYLGIPMKVMVQADMAAHKLVAMHERMGNANRDIFDVWFFLHNNWPINEKIVEHRTENSFKKFLEICIDDLETMSDRNILSGIGELLDAKQKAWAKANLRKETIFLLKLLLSN
jgi:predicted nucleotidyltransferase component of viral defense system